MSKYSCYAELMFVFLQRGLNEQDCGIYCVMLSAVTPKDGILNVRVEVLASLFLAKLGYNRPRINDTPARISQFIDRGEDYLSPNPLGELHKALGLIPFSRQSRKSCVSLLVHSPPDYGFPQL